MASLKRWRRFLVLSFFCCLLWSSWSSVADADSSKPSAASSSAAVPDRFNSGDNAWVLTSSALVLMMTAPGLALFYSGLVRRKNVLSMFAQCVFLMCLMTVIWAVYGYTLVFGGKDPWIGDLTYLCMRNVQPVWVGGQAVIPLYPDSSLPVLTHMLYQGMFFIITPALICGAFAERMKFSTMIVFSAIWSTVVYLPIAHWIWGGGVLAYGSPYVKDLPGIGVLDFAGGTVVHITSGVSALVCALMLGRRVGFGREPMPPHNMTYTAIGATMLWVGWFGFNAGSALAASRLASSAFATTHFAAAAGGLSWAALEWKWRGKPSVLGVCSGLVAGLACITQAAGYVTLMSALLIGALGGAACYAACTVVKARFGYDDSLDVFGVHGVAGTLGAIATGVFATRATVACGDDRLLGLLEGGTLLRAQLLAVVVAWGLAIVCTFVILKVLDAVMGLRVSPGAETEGLDLSQHGEEGYILN